MTTFASVLGVVPLLLAFGAGANSRFAIGMMICAVLIFRVEVFREPET